MKTKLISIVILLFLSVTLATAQDKGKSSFGILGGINFQNLNGKDYYGDKLENDMIIGYHVGVNVQLPIVEGFYFQPGLLFSTKGAKNTENSVTTTVNLSYIEMPLNFVYKGLLGKGYIMVGLGPYIGYGIMGKVKTETGTESSEQDIEFQKVVEVDDPLTVPYYKALDVGGNILFGYELPLGLFFQLNAQLGMLKINPEYAAFPEDKSSVKNTGFGLSMGYRF